MEGVEIKGMGSGWSWQTCHLYTLIAIGLLQETVKKLKHVSNYKVLYGLVGHI